MTGPEIKQFARNTLVVPRTIAQEISMFDALIDFISQSDTSDIPAWDDALTFNSDGSGAGAFATFPDTNDVLRLWKSKTMTNSNNEPPEDPLDTENTYWIEVSPATGSAIKEWAPGIYGSGLIIVFHDISGTGIDPALYVLTNPSRPFQSTDFSDELDAGSWSKLSSEIKFAKVTISSAEILALHTTPISLVASPGANKFIELIAVSSFYEFVSAAYTGAGAAGVFVGYAPDPTSINTHGSGININVGLSQLIKPALDYHIANDIINKALMVGAITSNPASGDGTLTFFISYRINSIL